MDPESARLVRDEIARLKSSQRTIVICSHNLTEVEALADQIAIIYRGKILIQGTLDELKKSVLGAPEYEVKFSNEWDSNGVALPQGVEMLDRTATSFRVRVANPQEANPQILKNLSMAPVMAFQEEPRTLEQVYLKVMTEAKGGENVH
jgi:ABC-2 type transport system ATP-binding protein